MKRLTILQLATLAMAFVVVALSCAGPASRSASAEPQWGIKIVSTVRMSGGYLQVTEIRTVEGYTCIAVNTVSYDAGAGISCNWTKP